MTLSFCGDGNTMNRCYSRGGHLKVLTAKQMTRPGEMTAMHWNVTGPQGIQGATGATGAQGIPRPKGDTGPAGTNVAAGEACPSGQFVTSFESSGNIICAAPTTTTADLVAPEDLTGRSGP